MKQMQDRLGSEPELAASYAAAHDAYLAARGAIGSAPEIEGVSAGGMPDRVKCLHVLAAQALAQGRGTNPLGDEVLDLLGDVVDLRALRGCGLMVSTSSTNDGSTSGMVAAIDCGTNTIKLLIGDLPAISVLETRIVRLGQDVDRTGRLAEEALASDLRRHRRVRRPDRRAPGRADPVLRHVRLPRRQQQRGVRRRGPGPARCRAGGHLR